MRIALLLLTLAATSCSGHTLVHSPRGSVEIEKGMTCHYVEARLGPPQYEQPDKVRGSRRAIYRHEDRVYVVRYSDLKVQWVRTRTASATWPNASMQAGHSLCE